MPDKDSATPRVFLLRHGPTEWSANGRYTGTTDISLLGSGEDLIQSTASHIWGSGKLIDPDRLAVVYCSPRVRARRTLEILAGGNRGGQGGEQGGGLEGTEGVDLKVTEDIAEWNYGEYEGLLTKEIRAKRKEDGFDSEREWDIWRDGCDAHGGERSADVSSRLDKIIAEILAVQGQYLDDLKRGAVEERRRRDVLVVAHGHILRGFVKRWLGVDLAVGMELMLEPGGVCGLSYAHGNVEERAVLVGMALPGGGGS